VVTMLACFVSFAREAVGAGQGTRHSLRPLSSRVIAENNSGASRSGNVDSYPHGCLTSKSDSLTQQWSNQLVMPAHVAGIHALLDSMRQERGWPGQGPAMTTESRIWHGSRRGNHHGGLESEWLTEVSAGGDSFSRHARVCRGHPRLASGNTSRTCRAGTRCLARP